MSFADMHCMGEGLGLELSPPLGPCSYCLSLYIEYAFSLWELLIKT